MQTQAHNEFAVLVTCKELLGSKPNKPKPTCCIGGWIDLFLFFIASNRCKQTLCLPFPVLRRSESWLLGMSQIEKGGVQSPVARLGKHLFTYWFHQSWSRASSSSNSTTHLSSCLPETATTTGLSTSMHLFLNGRTMNDMVGLRLCISSSKILVVLFV